MSKNIPTTKPKNKTKGTNENGLSTSDTEKLEAMFPDTPHLQGYDLDAKEERAKLGLKEGTLAPGEQWAPKTNFEYNEAPDTSQPQGDDTVGKDGGAARPDVANNPRKEDPSQPINSIPDAQGLANPVSTKDKTFKKLGDTLTLGVGSE